MSAEASAVETQALHGRMCYRPNFRFTWLELGSRCSKPASASKWFDKRRKRF